uniref:Uncharacterized protein n=1 Tax=Cucumis melo TaxID=3656 RepID=A0A9I9CU59_CUCME
MVAIFARVSLVNHYKKNQRFADAEKGNRKSDVKGRTPFHHDIMNKVSAIWISGNVAQITRQKVRLPRSSARRCRENI